MAERSKAYAWKADFTTTLTDGAIKAHVEFGPKVPVVANGYVNSMTGDDQD